MKGKHLWAPLLAAVLATLLSAAALAADTELTVRLPEATPKAGEAFAVTVEISGNPGLGAFRCAMRYDADAMNCESVSPGAVTSGMMFASNPKASTGAMFSGVSGDAAAGDGTMVEFRFKAKQDLDGAQFTLAEIELTLPDGTDVAHTVTDAQFDALEQLEQAKPRTAAKQPKETAKAETPAFADVSAGFWGAEWIARAAERGLFEGDKNGNFLPGAPVTRGDCMLVIWRMAGKPEPKSAAPFADVPVNAYYAKAVAWAYEQGIVNGKRGGFAPKDSLTRQEAMKILFGCAGGQSGMELLLAGTYDAAFTDSGEIAGWAKPAMYWAYYRGVISGTGKGATLSPTAPATRVQLAKMLVEYQDKIE